MITSAQKKLWIPLLVFIASAATYIKLLGSLWFLVTVPTLVSSFGFLCAYSGPKVITRISAWFNRDGW